jgi:hypothetical protein
MTTPDDVRTDLEHHPEHRGPFAVDTELALAALRFSWGPAYRVTARGGQWQARRRNGPGEELEADLPDGLVKLLLQDWGGGESP